MAGAPWLASSAVSGIDLRPVTDDDLDALVALQHRSNVHDGVPQTVTLDDVREELDDEQTVLATDTRVAVLDGALAGYAYTLHLPSEVSFERCYVFGTVDPAQRGRGVGRALLAWGVGRGREQLRATGRDLPRYLRVDAYDYQEADHRLFARAGFRPVRVFEELLRPLVDLPAARPVAEVRIEPWPEGRDEELRVVKNAAFADHWGSTPTSPAAWEQMVHGYGAWTERSLVAVDERDGTVVGYCLNHRYPADDEALGRRDGWIDNLGTLPAWRGRGVASALLIASLHGFAAGDCTHASIAVDSDSLTGAARLYRALGFELRQRSITHEIVVT